MKMTAAIKSPPRAESFVASFPGPGVFVVGVWAVLVAAAVYLIQNYASPIPLWDDYLLFPQLTGAEPVTPQWLWAVHYNHRIPLSKLVLVGLARLSHYDFRSGMYFNLFVLAALALLFLRAAKAIRGRTSYTDAFIPLLLLNFGHHRQFLWFWQVCYLLPMLLVGVILYLILRHGDSLSFRSAVTAGVCLLLLPLCGAMGLVFVPPLALWLGAAGWQMWSAGGRPGKRRGLVVFGLVAATFVLVVAYYANYQELSGTAPPAGGKSVKSILKTSLQFLSTGLGHLPVTFFPYSGYAVAGLLFLGGLALLLVWRQCPESRLRTWGVLLFAGAVLLEALGVGYGRSGEGWDVLEGLHCRYVTLAAFALLGLYFIWCLFPYPSVGQFFQMVLFTLLCFLVPYSVQNCLAEEDHIRSEVGLFDQELEAGVPPSFLTDRHWTWLYWLDNYQFKRERMARALENLHDAGVPYFKDLHKDPPGREVRLPPAPARAQGIRGDVATRAEAAGPDAFLEYALPGPAVVYGVRVKVSFLSPEVDVVDSRLSWSAPGEAEDAGAGRQASMRCENLEDTTARPPAPRVLTVAFWVNGPVSRFRFYPADKPTAFRVHEVSLLVAPGEDMPPDKTSAEHPAPPRS